MNDQRIQEGKTAAIISYLWWPGLLISFFMNNNNRNSFTSYHIRQSIGLSILSFALGLFAKYGVAIVADILFLGLFVFWVIGILGAIKGIEKPLPFIGEYFQDWFKNI